MTVSHTLRRRTRNGGWKASGTGENRPLIEGDLKPESHSPQDFAAVKQTLVLTGAIRRMTFGVVR
jgi:hypothetical protein